MTNQHFLNNLSQWFLVVIVGGLLACGRSEPHNLPQAGRVFVLGLDGVDPDLLDLLLAEGRLPHLAKLAQGGVYTHLRSAAPLLSPVVWTTIATGKGPVEHGIFGFSDPHAEAAGEHLPVTSRQRRVKALWNILSAQHRRVDVEGWWATWPAEEINGTLVSDHLVFHFLFEQGLRSGDDRSGSTWPASALAKLEPLVVRPQQIDLDRLAAYATVSATDLARPFDFADPVQHLRWAIAAAETHRRVALKLWNDDRPDALFAYVEEPDTVSHLFGHLFRQPGLVGPLADQAARFGRAVEAAYADADRIVGDVVAALDPSTTLIVLSDHGFALGSLPPDPRLAGQPQRTAANVHRPEGVLLIYAHRVKSGAAPPPTAAMPTIYDIAPTILALLGLAPAQDMPGRVLSELVDVPAIARVATYETAPPLETKTRAPVDVVDEEIVARLRSLGYVGGNESRSTADANEAALLFQARRFAEARLIYERILAVQPDQPDMLLSLAGVEAEERRYARARTLLEKALALDPLRPGTYYNLAYVAERTGDLGAALQNLRLALRCDPEFGPARRAYQRLTHREPVLFQPANDAEREALTLADQAADLARRGDFAAASRALATAERRAPRLPLIQQYRANLAYLQGDRKGAIAALEKGLALDPADLFFRENLRRLRQLGAD